MNISDDPIISDPELRRIAGGVTPMTIWRWRKAGILPPALVLNGRNYSRKSAIDAALSRAFGLENYAPNSQAT
ncbi:MAG TPA: hypothetical protein PLY96_17640 [Chromatiaceae bacterium]|jgi:hypothetical protein|nr:hypothetical protein [Gammaproteobacteria bacterium]HPB77060.1 hypothetical protein [Chromatiaceae bacterium]